MAIHHLKLKAAIKAYSEAEGDHAAKMAAIAEKGYTDAEMAEITEAISQLQPDQSAVVEYLDNTETATTKAETQIIPDTPTPQKSNRKGVPSNAKGDIVYLHNKATGLKQPMPYKNALQLARINSDQYSIVD